MTRMAFIASIVVVLLGIAACSEGGQTSSNQGLAKLTAEAEYRQARAKLAQASERLLRESSPVTDRQSLARRLKIDPARVQAFTDPTGGSRSVFQQTVPICTPDGFCECEGDLECNGLFSSVCRDPSTGGSCTNLPNGGVRCWCNLSKT
ncbi:MAG: hypothetical protein ACXW27_13360 [Allosphingosinicella sp.]